MKTESKLLTRKEFCKQKNRDNYKTPDGHYFWLPLKCVAAITGRAIYRRGQVDILSDRLARAGASEPLAAKIGPHIQKILQEACGEHNLKSYQEEVLQINLQPNEPSGNPIEIIATPNASDGYLYFSLIEHKLVEYVLVEPDVLWMWNFYKSKAAALRVKEGDPEKFKNHVVMTFDEYLKKEREQMLAPGASLITKEDFWGMLEVLPPNDWTQGKDFETFNMCEHTRGSFTAQYARCNVGGVDHYACQTVDRFDKSTWMTRETFRDLLKKGA